MTLAAAVMTLAACTNGGSAETTVTLSVSGDASEVRAFRQLVSAFEQAVPGVDVMLDAAASSGDQVAKLATAFSGGTPPDLFLMNFRRFGQFAARDVLEPLGPRTEASEVLDLDAFYPQAVDAFRYHGEQLCIPQNISNQVVYYNETLFADAGVAAPRGGWTWDEFLSTAKRMTRDTDDDGKADVYGLGVPPELITLAPFVWQNRAEVVDDATEPTKTILLDDPAIEAMTFFIELRRVHHVTPTHAEAESEDLEARFASGRLAMLIESRRATPALRAVPGLDWDVAPLPAQAQQATMLHSDAYCMTRASDVKDAAFRFVEFAVGPQGAPILARTGRTVPSLRSVAQSEAFLDPTQEPEHAQVWLDQIPFIRRTPVIATWNEIEERADAIVEEWYYGLEPPEALGIEIDLATRELFAERGIE